MNQIWIPIGIVLLGVYALGVMTPFAVGGLKGDYTPQSIPQSESEIIENCAGLDVEKTAYCLRDNVATFYAYNMTDGDYTDIETIKQYGGDCYNYARLYKRLGEAEGYNADILAHGGIIGLLRSSHTWALLYDQTGYCEIDGLNVNCVKNA